MAIMSYTFYCASAHFWLTSVNWKALERLASSFSAHYISTCLSSSSIDISSKVMHSSSLTVNKCMPSLHQKCSAVLPTIILQNFVNRLLEISLKKLLTFLPTSFQHKFLLLPYSSWLARFYILLFSEKLFDNKVNRHNQHLQLYAPGAMHF